MNSSDDMIKEAIGLLDRADYNSVETICKKLLQNNEDDFKANYILGYSYHLAGNMAGASAVLEKAKQLSPDNIEVFNTLGCVQRKMADYDNASASFSQAIRLNPGYVNAYINLGLVFLDQNKFDDAENNLMKALQLQPDSALCYASIGDLYRKQNAFPLAIEYYKTALAFNPALFDVHQNMGVIFKEAAMYDDAATCFNAALALNRDSIICQINLASTLEHLGKLDLARDIYNRVLAQENTDNSLSRTGAAISIFGESQQITSKHIEFNIGIIDLLQGNYKDGWPRYHYRPHRNNPNVVAEITDELRKNLSGKNILVVQEQGIGDELFFLRFMKKLKDSSATISYLPHHRLVNLLSHLSEIDNIVLSVEDYRQYDLVLSVADLPYFLSIDNAEEIPEPLTLTPKSFELNNIRTSLPQLGSLPHIAITWRGGSEKTSEHQHTLHKEIPLAELVRVLKPLSANIVVVQRDPTPTELAYLRAELGHRLIEMQDANKDMDKMLALMSLVDEYIGVSNTNMYLRAGVHKPSQALVPFPGEWRWLIQGKQSSWFPDNIIYRETAGNDWTQAMRELSAYLASSSSE